MIQEEISIGRWLLLQVSTNGLSICHLFFADDVFFFKAKSCQSRIINKVLNDFYFILGLKVSLEKYIVFSLADVTRGEKESITSTTSIQFTSNLDKYIGFQMHHGRIKIEDFASIMDKVFDNITS